MNKKGSNIVFWVFNIIFAFLLSVVLLIRHNGNGIYTFNEYRSASNIVTSNAISNNKLNINTASASELELLPGIGPAIAERIVNYRASNGQFQSVDELDNVKGIGPKILETIKPYITTGDKDENTSN